MFYGKPWVRSDVDFVIGEMKEKDMLFHNGVIIYKVAGDATDLLLQYLHPFVENGSGAVAIGMIREIIVNSNAQHPCAGSQFLLDNSAVNDPLVPIVAFTKDLFRDKHMDKLPFILTHEICHVTNNRDLDPAHAVALISQEHLVREKDADLRAVAILGENKSALSSLNFILNIIEKPEFYKNLHLEGPDVELHFEAVNQLKQRIVNIEQGA